mmetsp:Transcript_28496/g.72620  ORF Transcript_28496/g.72620 Transcript_28496/m.72620 type:complete len:275 (+) Transcript_28496:1877-2701(+)
MRRPADAKSSPALAVVCATSGSPSSLSPCPNANDPLPPARPPRHICRMRSSAPFVMTSTLPSSFPPSCLSTTDILRLCEVNSSVFKIRYFSSCFVPSRCCSDMHTSDLFLPTNTTPKCSAASSRASSSGELAFNTRFPSSLSTTTALHSARQRKYMRTSSSPFLIALDRESSLNISADALPCPYTFPRIHAFLNTISLRVSVPVLSVTMSVTMPKSSVVAILIDSAGLSFSSSYICRSELIKKKLMKRAKSRVTFNEIGIMYEQRRRKRRGMKK